MARLSIREVNPYAGKNIVYCEGNGPDDPLCLEKNPPPDMEMITGQLCAAGCRIPGRHGKCRAVFANRQKNPELFEESI